MGLLLLCFENRMSSCAPRKEKSSSSHFIQLPAGPWSLCSHVYSNHLAWFERPVLTPLQIPLLLLTSHNGSSAREARTAPSHRVAGINVVLPPNQLNTLKLGRMRVDGKRIWLSTPLQLKHLLKFQPLEDICPFFSWILPGHRHHFQVQDLSFYH